MTWETVKRTYLGTPPIAALYQPIEHPDFDGWPVLRGCDDRMALIMSELVARSVAPGTVVDLGCHTGWFCRAFARRRWRAIGIDRSGPWLDVARAMNGVVLGGDAAPQYLLADLETLDPLPPGDVALCLSCAMYFSWDRPSAWALCDRISRTYPLLFLDFGGMYADRLPFTERTVVAQFLARTQYTDGHVLGHSGDEARPLVVLTR